MVTGYGKTWVLIHWNVSVDKKSSTHGVWFSCPLLLPAAPLTHCPWWCLTIATLWQYFGLQKEDKSEKLIFQRQQSCKNSPGDVSKSFRTVSKLLFESTVLSSTFCRRCVRVTLTTPGVMPWQYYLNCFSIYSYGDLRTTCNLSVRPTFPLVKKWKATPFRQSKGLCHGQMVRQKSDGQKSDVMGAIISRGNGWDWVTMLANCIYHHSLLRGSISKRLSTQKYLNYNLIWRSHKPASLILGMTNYWENPKEESSELGYSYYFWKKSQQSSHLTDKPILKSDWKYRDC